MTEFNEISQAIKNGNIELLQQRLENGLSAKLQNDNGDTLMHIAARESKIEILRLLKKHGADPNQQNNNGYSPLCSAILGYSWGIDPKVYHTLVELGANPYEDNGSGGTLEDLAIELHMIEE